MELFEKQFEELQAVEGQLLEAKEGYYFSFLLDEEGDLFRVEFHADECVKIPNGGMEFITLSQENLFEIRELLNQANSIFNK